MSQSDDEKRRVIYDDLGSISTIASETARYISFGLIAVYYSLRTSDAGVAHNIFDRFSCVVSLVGLCGVLALLADFLQYFFGSLEAHTALKRGSLLFSTKSFSYRARKWTFIAKQIVAGTGALLLVGLFAIA